MDFTWQVLLAAAAHADRRTYKLMPPDNRGVHTSTVSELMAPYQSGSIEPAQLEDFRPYIDGRVSPRWSERRANDVKLGRDRFFTYRAWEETISQAELQPDVHLLFSSGINRMESQTYLAELTGGIKSLAPDDDFPYRRMKPGYEVTAFWRYLITGEHNKPGAIKAAASLEQQTNTIHHLLHKVFGKDIDMDLAFQMFELVLHVQTSKRRSGETARSILTPLMQTFNSRKLETVRQTLTQFILERPELVPLGFDRSLEIDRRAKASERRRAEAISRDAKKTELNNNFAELKDLVKGSERSIRCRFNKSKVDPATNSYVETNRWRTYLLNYPGHRERVVLLDVADGMFLDSHTKAYVTGPILYFLKLEEAGDGKAAKVASRKISGKKFFNQLGQKQGQIIERAINVEYLKRIALVWGDINERTPLLIDFIESQEDTDS